MASSKPIVFEKTREPEAMIYPNPVTKGQLVNVVFNKAVNGVYQVYSISGQLMRNGNVALNKSQRLSIPVQDWKAGTYIIRCADEKSGKVFSQKFVVQ